MIHLGITMSLLSMCLCAHRLGGHQKQAVGQWKREDQVGLTCSAATWRVGTRDEVGPCVSISVYLCARGGWAELASSSLSSLSVCSRALETYSSSDCSTFVDQCEQGSAEAVTDHIAHYLMSLAQPEPTATNRVCVAAERDGDEQNNQTSVQPSDTSSHAHVRAPRGSKLAESHSSQSCEQLSNSMLSRCDVESVWSDWSMRSGSTFDTRDEAAFRDGLSALDASIASLQKTLQLDLGRWRTHSITPQLLWFNV